MADDRLIQRLEEQLSEAHATNGSLRAQLDEMRKESEKNRALASHVADDKYRLGQAEAKRKSAEKADRLEGELLRAREDLDRLHALEDRVAAAQGIGDLFS
jgi:regulator of replication initiation timing